MTFHGQDFDYFRQQLHRLTGIDLAAYKERQMRRRLTVYLERSGLADFKELAQIIVADAAQLEKLKAYLTINVSEFFRDGHPFEALAQQVLPELRETFDALKIWSAGCSFGYEPYSVAMLLAEQDPGGQHEILGTDLDDEALAVARKGWYSEEKLKGVSQRRRRQFFQRQGEGWQVGGQLSRLTRFRRHDLLRDPYPGGQHLILCRNVVIYFTEEAKAQVHRQLAQALVPGGYLLVGATETIFSAHTYGLESAGPFLYRRRLTATPTVGPAAKLPVQR